MNTLNNRYVVSHIYQVMAEYSKQNNEYIQVSRNFKKTDTINKICKFDKWRISLIGKARAPN